MEVRAWNRTPAKAAALAADGALVALSPAAAAAGVTVLITMLTDGAAVEDVMTGPDGALSALGPDAVWIQTIADGPADAAHGQGLELPLTDALLSRWHQAVASGHGQDDVASAITVSAVTGDHAVRL
jgi:3-hydroxyisobutyrate dehydrogenase-like beta-hydroxyacid dehydrogenase